MEQLGANDPRRIGDYRLLGVLGAGGMGKVYLGRNSGGRTVSVKVIRPDLVGDVEFRTRFRREVAAAQRVGSAFTAPVLDADVDADPPWLATGYVAGLSLSDAVTRFGPFAEPTLLALAHGLAEALVAVHATGIVHRDLKPSNVMLAIDGPKVIDFGIARAAEDVALTTTGRVIGSPGFMCPEQVSGEPLGPACDVFALGGVLIFAASGHGPFGSAELVQMLWRIVYEQPRVDSLPPSLRPVVTACLAKDPAARPTPQQLRTELATLGKLERSGWLPPAVLEEVSVRAIRLLDLDSGPPELDTTITADPNRPITGGSAAAAPTDTSAPHRPSGSGGHIPRTSPETSAPSWPPVTEPGWRRDASSPVWSTAAHRDYPSPSRPGVAAAHPEFSAPNRPTATGQNPLVDATVRRQVGGEGPWQPSAAPTGGPGAGPRRDRTRRTRVLLTVAIVAVLAAAAGGAFLIGTQLRDQPDGDTVASSVVVPTGTETSADTVPDAFLGDWSGQAADGPVRFAIELSIGAGSVGEELAFSANTGAVAGERCDRAETLTAASERRLEFRARLTTTGSSCVDDGATSTVTLERDGTLRYSTPGLLGSITGVLRKS
ncbi:serine/threonine-protein kinase [Nocardia mangyaensis]|uniref:serine/threonine-protein kinase n=1 Tax=Nocardia mangyaensis TaxID=2213200 RepID=UPI002676801B|nr:serine/threonine-protein kinase [Nocardia mangyaensis]MDO3650449.1 protein kinase [Nocardia mangyaensis]